MAVLKKVPVKWAAVQAPNTTFDPCWSVDAVLTKEQAKALQAEGLSPKKDKDGDIILKFKRNVDRADGTQNNPPRVIDASKAAMTDLIGNGSICNIQYNVYEWKWKSKAGVSAGLMAIQVLDLVPYKGAEDEFEVEEDFGGEADELSDQSDDSDSEDDFDDDLPF